MSKRLAVLLPIAGLVACLTRPQPWEPPPLPPPTAKASAAPSASPEVATTAAPTGTAAEVAPPPATDGLPSAPKGVLRREQADAILKLGDAPIVKLLEAGAEPRQSIAFDLKAKEKQATDMRMSIAMSVSQPGQPAHPSRLPEVSLLLDLVNGKRAKNGDVEVTGSVGKVGVIPKNDAEAAAAKDIATALEPTKGLKFTYVVSPKGRVRDLKVDAAKVPARAKQLVEQLKQSFEAMTTPLPDEPIGVGARWQMIQRLQSGADVIQFTTYTLRSVEKERIVIESDVVQFAAGSSFTPEGMSSPVQISEFASRGKGASSVSFAHVAPDQHEAALRGRILMTVPQGGETLVDTEVGVRFAAPGAAPAPAPPAPAPAPKTAPKTEPKKPASK